MTVSFEFFGFFRQQADHIHISVCKCYTIFLGGLSEVVPPLSIPNRVVKRFSGDDNELARACENTSLPGFFLPI